MSMILNATLRLYFPVVLIIREVERAVRLAKLVVPAKMEVLVSL